MKRYKTRIMNDLRKLNVEELYALIHLAFWEVDHDCGKGCTGPHFTDRIQQKLEEYCYYDHMHEKEE